MSVIKSCSVHCGCACTNDNQFFMSSCTCEVKHCEWQLLWVVESSSKIMAIKIFLLNFKNSD